MIKVIWNTLSLAIMICLLPIFVLWSVFGLPDRIMKDLVAGIDAIDNYFGD